MMGQYSDSGPDRTSWREEQVDQKHAVGVIAVVLVAIVLVGLLVLLVLAWGMGEWLKAGSGLDTIMPGWHL